MSLFYVDLPIFQFFAEPFLDNYVARSVSPTGNCVRKMKMDAEVESGASPPGSTDVSRAMPESTTASGLIAKNPALEPSFADPTTGLSGQPVGATSSKPYSSTPETSAAATSSATTPQPAVTGPGPSSNGKSKVGKCYVRCLRRLGNLNSNRHAILETGTTCWIGRADDNQVRWTLECVRRQMFFFSLWCATFQFLSRSFVSS